MVQKRQNMRKAGIFPALVLAEKVNTSRQEIDSRLRKKLVAAAAFIALFHRFYQSLGTFDASASERR